MIPTCDRNPRVAARLLLLPGLSCATAALLIAIAGCGSPGQPPRVPPPPKVTVVVARKMTLPLVVKPIGTTRALNDVTIRARVKGFLQEKHFDDGKNVKKGQLLLVIEERPYQVQLEMATAQLAAAKADLEKATASKIVPVSRAKVSLNEAQLSLDMIEERRARNLLARNAASQEDYDKAESQRKKSAAQVESDRANLAQSEADYRIGIDNAKAEVSRAEAGVEDAQINLGYCRMYAPIDGRIGELKVKLGNLVGDSGSTDLVNLQQLDPMGLDLLPAARYLPIATSLQDHGGTPVNVAVEGERLHPHVGKTIFVDNKVDVETGTFLVRGDVPNPDGAILPGQYIKASIVIGKYVDAVVVPEQSVLEGQEGARVFVVDSEKKVQSVKVTPIDDYQGLRVLESGLEAGQRVIVDGLQFVKPGQVVDAEEVPLDKFQQKAPQAFNADPRFSSKVSRLPGIDTQSPGDSPQEKSATPEPKKVEPGPKKALPEAKTSSSEAKVDGDLRPVVPTEKKGR